MDNGYQRKIILAARDALSDRELLEKSRNIGANLWPLLADKLGDIVMLYASFRSEVQTGEIISKCLGNVIRVALPVTDQKSKRLLPYLVNEPDRDLHPGYYGIPEPDPERATPVAPAEISAVIIPGSVFDLKGGRYGYGGGYYDRFLEKDAPQAERIAIAFDLQVVEGNLVLAPHDKRMDCLVTESRVIRVNRDKLLGG